MGLFLVQNFQYVFIGNFCHGEKYFAPLGVGASYIVFLPQDSQQIVEGKKSFACSTDLEVVLDRVIDLSSFAVLCRLAS